MCMEEPKSPNLYTVDSQPRTHPHSIAPDCGNADPNFILINFFLMPFKDNNPRVYICL